MIGTIARRFGTRFSWLSGRSRATDNRIARYVAMGIHQKDRDGQVAPVQPTWIEEPVLEIPPQSLALRRAQKNQSIREGSDKADEHEKLIDSFQSGAIAAPGRGKP